MESSLIPSQPSRAPIEQLSDGILVQIFLHHKADPGWRAPPWFRVLWVCKRWSRMGRQSPVLWHKITMRSESKEGFLQASLQYSSNKPLYVSFWTFPDLVKSATLLSQHASRIRNLTVVNPKHKDPGLPVMAHQEMPLLEELRISLYPDTRKQSNLLSVDLLPWTPSVNQLPSIQRLSLSGVSLSEPLPVFPLLRYLHLEENIENSLDIHTFVEYLSRLPCLEELEMQKYRLGGTITPTALSLPQTLRRFSIEDNAEFVKPFLSAFSFPPSTQVRVFRAIDYFRGIEDFARFNASTHLTATQCLPDSLTAVFPVLSQVTSVELRRREDMKFKFIGTTPGGNLIKIGGRVPEGAEREITDPLCLLRDITKIFASSPLAELRINGTDSALSKKSDWVLVQRAFPRLERLTIERVSANSPWDMRYPLLDALRKLRRLKGQAEGNEGLLAWPRLRTLALVTDVLDREDEKLSKSVAEALEFRASRGCRLGELRIILKYFDERFEEANEKRKELYRTALGHLVDHLEFDVVMGW